MTNKTPWVLFLAALFTGLGSRCLAAELKLHYTFDEGSGTTAASAVNANAGNVLNLIGASTWAPGMPGFGTAMEITGVSGRAQAVDPASWSAQTITGSSTGSISMAVWINLSSFPATGVPTLMGSVSSQALGYHHQMLIRMDGATTRLPNDKANAWGQTFGSGASVATSRDEAAAQITAGEWTHYAVTFDSTTKTTTLYMNGTPVSTATNELWTGYWNASDLVRSIVGSDNNNSVKGLYDDARIYNGVLTPAEVLALIPSPPTFPLSITPNLPDSRFQLEWVSQPGKIYNIRSNIDLNTDISTWSLVEVDGLTDIPATPPANIANVNPTEPKLFYRVEEHPAPPVVLFNENFDGADPGWSTGFNAGDTLMETAWQLGAPSVVGPATASSGANCYGTNLSSDYGFNSNTWLRTPTIDLTSVAVTSANVSFRQFREIEAGFDFGYVRVLDATNDTPLGSDIAFKVTGVGTAWETFSADLPAEALGKSIKLEFQFVSDELNVLSGWYIDDVKIIGTP